MSVARRPRVMLVDDEPQLVEGLARHLRLLYDVHTATSGDGGLELLERQGPFTVVVSDMRMPGMNGAAFLAKVKERAPGATRMLLTGQSDLDSAIAAINEGQVFRFLSKPCAPPHLLAAVAAAVEFHRLVHVERTLLEETLHGVVRMLTDIIALSNPAALGRANRIKHLVSQLAEKTQMRERWQVEVAAMVSQLGFISLPIETIEKVYFGWPLDADEQAMASRVPAVTEQLLAHVPRLEEVRAILASSREPFKALAGGARSESGLVEQGAELLKVAQDFDELRSQGTALEVALDVLRGRTGRYDPDVLEALRATQGDSTSREAVKELPLSGLRAGMLVADDVRMSSGPLLVTRGYEITEGFLERIRNFARGAVREPVRVIIPAPKG